MAENICNLFYRESLYSIIVNDRFNHKTADDCEKYTERFLNINLIYQRIRDVSVTRNVRMKGSRAICNVS